MCSPEKSDLVGTSDDQQKDKKVVGSDENPEIEHTDDPEKSSLGAKRELEENVEKDAKKAKHNDEWVVPRYVPNNARQAVTAFSADWKKALEKVALDPTKDRCVFV